MAHGLETRVPFLDNDLVEFASGFPSGCKLGNLGEVVSARTRTSRDQDAALLRADARRQAAAPPAMERHIPRRVTDAVKQGFSAPDASWFRGESIDYVRRRLLDPRARIYEYLDSRRGGRARRRAPEWARNRRLLIWSLLSFEQWCRTFLDGERPE